MLWAPCNSLFYKGITLTRKATNQVVGGSNPSGRAIRKKRLPQRGGFFYARVLAGFEPSTPKVGSTSAGALNERSD